MPLLGLVGALRQRRTRESAGEEEEEEEAKEGSRDAMVGLETNHPFTDAAHPFDEALASGGPSHSSVPTTIAAGSAPVPDGSR